MNVLFLTCWYPSKDEPTKGIFIKEHAAAVHLHSEHKLTVLAIHIEHSSALFKITTSVHEDENGIKTHDIRIQTFLYELIYSYPLFISRYINRYYRRRIQPDFEPDLIHAHVISPAGILGYKLAAAQKKQLVISEHWSKVDRFMRRNLLHRLARKAYNTASAVTTVSEYLRQNIAKYFYNTSKIKVVPNVINTDTFSYRANTPKGSTTVFTAIAKWTAPKRPDLFVNALQRIVSKTQMPVELHFFGRGPLLDSIRDQSLDPRLKIVYHGLASKKEIAEQLQQSHFMLHASEIETFSIVVAEALCTGTPVIASDKGALPELVNESNGVLCENTVDSWENGITAVLKKSYDHKTISESMNTQFSPQRIGELFSAIYKSVRDIASH